MLALGSCGDRWYLHPSGRYAQRDEMRRFLVSIGIVIIILLGLAFLTEGSAIVPFLYRSF